MALAGIMGGLDSEVTAATTQVLMESAYFNPAPSAGPPSAWGSEPRRPTGSSGGDPDGVIHALERATQLMAGGRRPGGRQGGSTPIPPPYNIPA